MGEAVHDLIEDCVQGRLCNGLMRMILNKPLDQLRADYMPIFCQMDMSRFGQWEMVTFRP